jgi:RNase adapter protein RapZ
MADGPGTPQKAGDESHVVVVTGMSGAGRSAAAKVLEDLGYFVIDNLPAELIVDVVEGSGVGNADRDRFAVVVDTRGGVTADTLAGAVAVLRSKGLRTTVLYLDAADRVLVRRYEENRRPHPLPGPTLEESIASERGALVEVRALADLIADTTDLNVHELGDRLRNAFSRGLPEGKLQVDVTSFGFAQGVPRVLDLLFDARFLPNPHWVPELRELTGRDLAVREYVFSYEKAGAFVERIFDLLDFLIPEYEREGKSYLTIGIGCTGGRHRSVAIAEEIGDHLRERGVDVTVHHRDAGLAPDDAHRH